MVNKEDEQVMAQGRFGDFICKHAPNVHNAFCNKEQEEMAVEQGIGCGIVSLVVSTCADRGARGARGPANALLGRLMKKQDEEAVAQGRIGEFICKHAPNVHNAFCSQEQEEMASEQGCGLVKLVVNLCGRRG